MAQLIALLIAVIVAIVAFLRSQGVNAPDLGNLTSSTPQGTTTTPQGTTTTPQGTTTTPQNTTTTPQNTTTTPQNTTTTPQNTTTTPQHTTTTPQATTTTPQNTTTTQPPSGSFNQIRDGLRAEIARPIWNAVQAAMDAYVQNLWHANAPLRHDDPSPANDGVHPKATDLHAYLNDNQRKPRLRSALGNAGSNSLDGVIQRIALLRTEIAGPAEAIAQRFYQDIERIEGRETPPHSAVPPCAFDDYWKNNGQGATCLAHRAQPLQLTKQRYDRLNQIHDSIQENEFLQNLMSALNTCRSMPTAAPPGGGQPNNVLCGEARDRLQADVFHHSRGVLVKLEESADWLATDKLPWRLIADRDALVTAGNNKTMHWMTQFTTRCQYSGTNYTVGGFAKSAHDSLQAARDAFGRIQNASSGDKVENLVEGLHQVLKAMYFIGRINGEHAAPSPTPTPTPPGSCPPGKTWCPGTGTCRLATQICPD
ncbi:MAG: hypothetical protein HY553_00790 [Elusimicrobia bacterium]|nr:hypothetical protein [Elusimicrobiota bacterium]